MKTSHPNLLLLYINDLLDVICNTNIYADDATLNSKCEQASDSWQQLGLASEVECDLQDIINWSRKGLVDLNAEKSQFVLFDLSNNSDIIDAKMNVFLKRKLIF